LRVLVDTNVVLDVLLAREPFAAQAAQILALVERARIEASLCATTVTTLHYLLTQSLPADEARQAMRGLLDLFEIAPVNRPDIEQALQSKIADFEDAVLEQAGRLVGANAIITRNTKGFLRSSIKALDPQEFLASLAA
jgi:predicted nucleic acid-binding protein